MSHLQHVSLPDEQPFTTKVEHKITFTLRDGLLITHYNFIMIKPYVCVRDIGEIAFQIEIEGR